MCGFGGSGGSGGLGLFGALVCLFGFSFLVVVFFNCTFSCEFSCEVGDCGRFSVGVGLLG